MSATVCPINTAPAGVILAIDDDPVMLATIRATLKKFGYETIEAADGQEGIELYDQYKPDLILLDVMMPVMDGYETCRQLRQRANSEFLPIIMLTGLNDMESIDHAFESGATDFITKPLNPTLVGQRVRYAMRSRALTLELEAKQAQLRSAQRIARLGYLEIALHDWSIHIGEQCAELFEITPECGNEISLNELIAKIHPDDQIRFVKTIEASLTHHQPHNIDYRIKLADGGERVLQHRGEMAQSSDGRAPAMMCTIIDITDRKHAEEIIKYQTYYDILTGIPNRKMLNIRLNQAISKSESGQDPFALLFVAIDRFKQLNDALGHNVGDLLLKAIAERLRPLEADGHQIFRFGGNIFALLVNGIDTPAEARDWAEGLLLRLTAPLEINQQSIYPSTSIGVALCPTESNDPDELSRGADTAMHIAKELGGNTIQLFASEMNRRSRQRATLETDLRQALERGELLLHYQPQVDARSRAIVGMEALLRWFHPQRGLISPVEFIPIAEEVGLIEEIGLWVLQSACQQTAHWHSMGHAGLRVGVNLSPRQFRHSKLLPGIEAALNSSGLPPHKLDLEITESLAMKDIRATIATLQQMREMGTHTSIDDFGTGHSSLSYLRSLPLDTLKIDRAFVRDIDEHGQHGEIARMIIAMAHSLEMSVIAEGVETEAQFEFLKLEGCEEIQGFLFSPPVAAEKFEEMLAQEAGGVKL